MDVGNEQRAGYIHLRRLERPVPISGEVAVPSLGPKADEYLWRHGWDTAARSTFVRVFNGHHTKHGFVKSLMARGAPGAEMEFLWDLIMEDQDED